MEATKNSEKNIKISSNEFISKSLTKIDIIGGILRKEALIKLY